MPKANSQKPKYANNSKNPKKKPKKKAAKSNMIAALTSEPKGYV
tara:strand:+ start:212 stop:343 length:132 start_codon:yes stop_codon:yes gene_type:complete